MSASEVDLSESYIIADRDGAVTVHRDETSIADLDSKRLLFYVRTARSLHFYLDEEPPVGQGAAPAFRMEVHQSGALVVDQPGSGVATVFAPGGWLRVEAAIKDVDGLGDGEA